MFLVSNFLNLAILVGEKMGKISANSRINVNNKKLAKKIGIENLKKIMLLLMSKIFKLILIIPTLNT
jgi:hypothetical protein